MFRSQSIAPYIHIRNLCYKRAVRVVIYIHSRMHTYENPTPTYVAHARSVYVQKRKKRVRTEVI